MSKRALIVGINEYDNVASLSGSVADAEAMERAVDRHDDGSINFECRVLTSPGPTRITRGSLRHAWSELFESFDGDVLFYFSGHGANTDLGGYLATQEATQDDPGLSMQDVVDLANKSKAKNVLIILDCCFSGSAGNPASGLENTAVLREGVTILAASRPSQVSLEVGGHGVFTDLVVGALTGGAADVRGRVSAASIYAYAEAALGAWDQRPIYKSHATSLDPVRLCEPKVPDSLLRELTKLFLNTEYEFQLDPTFEETNVGCANEDHVEIFKKFKRLQIAGLVKPKSGDDLFWSAERSGRVILTTLGKFYFKLVADNRI